MTEHVLRLRATRPPWSVLAKARARGPSGGVRHVVCSFWSGVKVGGEDLAQDPPRAPQASRSAINHHTCWLRRAPTREDTAYEELKAGASGARRRYGRTLAAALGEEPEAFDACADAARVPSEGQRSAATGRPRPAEARAATATAACPSSRARMEEPFQLPPARASGGATIESLASGGVQVVGCAGLGAPVVLSAEEAALFRALFLVADGDGDGLLSPGESRAFLRRCLASEPAVARCHALRGGRGGRREDAALRASGLARRLPPLRAGRGRRAGGSIVKVMSPQLVGEGLQQFTQYAVRTRSTCAHYGRSEMRVLRPSPTGGAGGSAEPPGPPGSLEVQALLDASPAGLEQGDSTSLQPLGPARAAGVAHSAAGALSSTLKESLGAHSAYGPPGLEGSGVAAPRRARQAAAGRRPCARAAEAVVRAKRAAAYEACRAGRYLALAGGAVDGAPGDEAEPAAAAAKRYALVAALAPRAAEAAARSSSRALLEYAATNLGFVKRNSATWHQLKDAMQPTDVEVKARRRAASSARSCRRPSPRRRARAPAAAREAPAAAARPAAPAAPPDPPFGDRPHAADSDDEEASFHNGGLEPFGGLSEDSVISV
ncbi:hypothetical protein SO694_00041153 [Aureococcus anophagefferens]|uniref:EF-hand domain-containing protein n=1 Tax=Aureococcus anophagefferens TaxID=44056 RepID=A0ABR1G733_AURAN